MKRFIFLIFAMFVVSAMTAFSQRSYVMYGTYEASDTTTVINNKGRGAILFSHVGYDSIGFWISASDSVSVYVDRMPSEATPEGIPYAKGSWATVDSLVGTTNNGTVSGYGNLINSTAFKSCTPWNYYYRLRFKSSGNAAAGGNFRFGWYLKKN